MILQPPPYSHYHIPQILAQIMVAISAAFSNPWTATLNNLISNPPNVPFSSFTHYHILLSLVQISFLKLFIPMTDPTISAQLSWKCNYLFYRNIIFCSYEQVHLCWEDIGMVIPLAHSQRRSRPGKIQALCSLCLWRLKPSLVL